MKRITMLVLLAILLLGCAGDAPQGSVPIEGDVTIGGDSYHFEGMVELQAGEPTATPSPSPTPTEPPLEPTPTELPPQPTPTATPTATPSEPTPTPTPTPTPEPTEGVLYGYASYRRPGNLPLAQLGGYSNFLYVFHSLNTGSPTQAELQALRDAGIKIVLKVSSQAVEENWNEAALLNLKARIDPYQDVIVALGVIDEPYSPSKAWTPQQLEELVGGVKGIFPEYQMYVNFLSPYYTEVVTGQPFPSIPDNIDLVSMDMYLHLPELSGGAEEYLSRIRRNLDIMEDRAGDRFIFWFAPAYGVQNRESSWPTIEQAWLDYDLSTEYGLGLCWYFQEDSATVTVGGRVLALWGASHFPELIQAHGEIGAAMLGEQPPPPPPPPPEPTPTPIPTPTVIPTPPPGDVSRWLVIRVNEPSCSEEFMRDNVFGSVSSIHRAYNESSMGAVSIIGDVTSVNFAGAINCSSRGGWADQVDALVLGYDVNSYDRRAYVLPSGTCSWGGNVDFSTRRLYTDECSRPKILAHEHGHLIGTYHASTSNSEYGDLSCIMGGGGPMVQFNAPHRVGLGWANPTTITEGGIYTLIATELDDHVILRTEKDTSNWYYLSFRAPIGEDADLGTEYVSRVSIHSFSKSAGPGVASRSTLLATLGAGDKFTTANLTVTCLEVAQDSAMIQIEMF